MTCQELVELVTDYFEEALSPEQRSRFEAHLKDCGNCPLYLDQMRVTKRMVGTLAEDHISPAAREELLELFRNWKHQP